MEIVNLKIEELTPYEKNAKRHPQEQVDQIADSIRKFGMNDPIGVWGDKNIIVEGHGRYLACKFLGIKEVPCIRLDNLTDAERKEYTLIHNKTTMNSGFEDDILQEELAWIYEHDKSIDMSKFDFMMADVEAEEIVDDEFEPVIPQEPSAKRGDIYQLGEHRLMCGDSTSPEDVKQLLDGATIDLVETDPPYNVAVENSDGLTIENDNMAKNDFLEFLKKAFFNIYEALKAGGVFYIWYASSSASEFLTALKENGLAVKEQLIWVKNHFTLGRQDYQWRHEPCLYGWKEGSGHYFIDDRTNDTIWDEINGEIDWSKMKKEELVKRLEEIYSNVHFTTIQENKPTKDSLHPTMKPMPLIARQIANSTRKGEKVLDLFSGSGTTLMCCDQLGRQFYGMEYDPRFVDVIIQRWEETTGKKAVKIN